MLNNIILKEMYYKIKHNVIPYRLYITVKDLCLEMFA